MKRVEGEVVKKSRDNNARDGRKCITGDILNLTARMELIDHSPIRSMVSIVILPFNTGLR